MDFTSDGKNMFVQLIKEIQKAKTYGEKTVEKGRAVLLRQV